MVCIGKCVQGVVYQFGFVDLVDVVGFYLFGEFDGFFGGVVVQVECVYVGFFQFVVFGFVQVFLDGSGGGGVSNRCICVGGGQVVGVGMYLVCCLLCGCLCFYLIVVGFEFGVLFF